MSKPNFDETFFASILILVVLRVATYAMAQVILENNGTEFNPFGLDPGSAVVTTALWLIPMVAIAFFKRSEIRFIAYSLLIAILAGDFVWDSLQLLSISVEASIAVDWAVVASIPAFIGIWQIERAHRSASGNEGHSGRASG